MFSRGLRIRVCALFALLSIALGTAQFAAAIDVAKLPKPTGYVSDLAHVLTADQQEQLEAFCTRVDHELGVQLALVTVESLDGQPVRDVALDIGRKWGVGNKANQGVLLLLAIKDRQSDIETGYGTEAYLTDGFAGSTLRAMRPDLRAGDYGQALITAAHSMAGQIATGKGVSFTDAALPPQREEQPESHHGGGIPFSVIILGIFFLLWLFGRGGGRRGGGYRRGGGAGNFLTGMLIGNMLGGGGRGGNDWGGGGFGGGGGGGGGFGGFGGGDFGGGGASSNW